MTFIVMLGNIMTLHKKYVLDENKKPIAVMLPISEFERLETIIEDYGLSKLIDETVNDESLIVNEAKEFYGNLKKDVED